MSANIPVGLVFSITGPYSAVASAMLNGAMLAINEVNADARYDFILEPKIVDPAGRLDGYRGACEQMLKHSQVRHIVGCYTSSSRKEVIPCFEKYDGLLWYPSHYEGFETSSNVIYTGAAPQSAHRSLGKLHDGGMRKTRLLRRIELYLGLGKQQNSERDPDRQRR